MKGDITKIHITPEGLSAKSYKFFSKLLDMAQTHDNSIQLLDQLCHEYGGESSNKKDFLLKNAQQLPEFLLAVQDGSIHDIASLNTFVEDNNLPQAFSALFTGESPFLFGDLNLLSQHYTKFKPLVHNQKYLNGKDSRRLMGRLFSQRIFNQLVLEDKREDIAHFSSASRLCKYLTTCSQELYYLVTDRLLAKAKADDYVSRKNRTARKEQVKEQKADFSYDPNYTVSSNKKKLANFDVIKEVCHYCETHNINVKHLKKLLFDDNGIPTATARSSLLMLNDFFSTVPLFEGYNSYFAGKDLPKLEEELQARNDHGSDPLPYNKEDLTQYIKALKAHKNLVAEHKSDYLTKLTLQIGERTIAGKQTTVLVDGFKASQNIFAFLLREPRFHDVSAFKKVYDQYASFCGTITSDDVVQPYIHETIDTTHTRPRDVYQARHIEYLCQLDQLPPMDTAQLLHFFDALIKTEQTGKLGPIVEDLSIQTTESAPLVAQSHPVVYPSIIVEALGELYLEYNLSFKDLVNKNKEWETDYQYALDSVGNPINYFVQIDMTGLPPMFLELAARGTLTKEQIITCLRHRVYEIENSLAMYQLLERVFAQNSDSQFKDGFRRGLEKIRTKHNKPIALLAVTDAKYEAMKQGEFGKLNGEPLSDEEVKQLSGFDAFFGPEEFKQLVTEHGDHLPFLFYARTSLPTEKLKNPNADISNKLLDDPELRKAIKAHSITFNIDGPSTPYSAKINDTKEYLAPMNMAYSVYSASDIFSAELLLHLDNGLLYEKYKGAHLSETFVAFLRAQGLNPSHVATGKLSIRCKPLKETYGCYGHFSGALTNGKVRDGFLQSLKERYGYCIQVEMPVPHIIDEGTKTEYMYIDRNFAYIDPDTGLPHFISGFRSLMPTDTMEAQKGRVHGNKATVWQPIY